MQYAALALDVVNDALGTPIVGVRTREAICAQRGDEVMSSSAWREGGDGARPVWCRLVQMGAPRVARGRHSQSSTLEQSSAIVTTAWNPVDGLPSSGSPGRRRCHTRFVTIVPDQPSPTSLVFAKSLKQCSLCRPGRSCSILRTISALNLSMHLGDRCFSSSSSEEADVSVEFFAAGFFRK